jgi:hypothetical protein
MLPRGGSRPDGCPRFYDLMRRRAPQYFYAFDLLWKEGLDLQELPLIKRKRMLKKIVKPRVLFVDHVVGRGVDLLHAVRERDLEGIVAKAAQGLYQPEKTTWVKIKNRNYSQAAGRRDFFDLRRKLAMSEVCTRTWTEEGFGQGKDRSPKCRVGIALALALRKFISRNRPQNDADRD